MTRLGNRSRRSRIFVAGSNRVDSEGVGSNFGAGTLKGLSNRMH